jgi:hypothetical protein
MNHSATLALSFSSPGRAARETALLVRWFGLLFVLLGPLLISCQSRTVQKVVKAKPAELSPFLDKREEMQPARHRLPVHKAWSTRDQPTLRELARCTEIFVAPVELRYLQPVEKEWAQLEIANGWMRRDEARMAQELRGRFAHAFRVSPQPRFRLVTEPTPRSVTLRLAITELNPTCKSGNVLKKTAGFFVGPMAAVMGIFTKGNIAIEGKVSVSASGAQVFQFADNEKDKITVYNARDLQPYAHALVAINEWAAQFEEFTRTMNGHRIDESSFITLKLW